MDKPEFCEGWEHPTGVFQISNDGLPMPDAIYRSAGLTKTKWRQFYNEAGEVIRLERVET